MKHTLVCGLLICLVGCSSPPELLPNGALTKKVLAHLPTAIVSVPTPIFTPSVVVVAKPDPKVPSFDELFSIVSNTGADFDRRVGALQTLLSGSYPIPEFDSWNKMRAAKIKYDAAVEDYKQLSSFSLDDLPSKPEYSPPQYHGTYLISGTYGGRFTNPDGIWIEANDHIYVIEDAEVRGFFSYTNGYVEDTGRTVWTNIGRGREAKVVRLMDHASYVDDQRSFALEQAQYENAYRAELTEYQAARHKQQAQLVKFAQLKTKTELALKSSAERLVSTMNTPIKTP